MPERWPGSRFRRRRGRDLSCPSSADGRVSRTARGKRRIAVAPKRMLPGVHPREVPGLIGRCFRGGRGNSRPAAWASGNIDALRPARGGSVRSAVMAAWLMRSGQARPHRRTSVGADERGRDGPRFLSRCRGRALFPPALSAGRPVSRRPFRPGRSGRSARGGGCGPAPAARASSPSAAGPPRRRRRPARA